MSNSEDGNNVTGGQWDTGGTGGPGPSGYDNTNNATGNDIRKMNVPGQTIEDYAREIAYQGLIIATGGIGGIPTSVHEAQVQNVTIKDMRKVLINTIGNMNSVEDLIDNLKKAHDEFLVVLDKANSQTAFNALPVGLYLLKLQAVRYGENRRDWVAWANTRIKFISKRSREKYMSLASLPMVEEHLEYGVERLAEIGSHYAKLSDEERTLLGDDPVARLMEKKGLTDDIPFDERKAKLDAIIEVYKLERMKVYIPPETMEDFLDSYPPLTGDERKYLKKISQDDQTAPENHLNRIIGKELKRSEFIPSAGDSNDGLGEGESETASSSDQQESASLRSIPNIDKQLTTLSQSLKVYLRPGAKVKGKVDVAAVENLITELEAFKQKLQDAGPAK